MYLRTLVSELYRLRNTTDANMTQLRKENEELKMKVKVAKTQPIKQPNQLKNYQKIQVGGLTFEPSGLSMGNIAPVAVNSEEEATPTNKKENTKAQGVETLKKTDITEQTNIASPQKTAENKNVHTKIYRYNTKDSNKQFQSDSQVKPRECLLVHDHFHKSFDESRFSRRYKLNKVEIDQFNTMLKNDNIIGKVRKLKPEAIFIHAGLKELWSGRSPEDTLHDMKKLVNDLLRQSTARICISPVIPVTGYPNLNGKISSLNEGISSFVTELRTRNDLRTRIYTQDNNKLAGYLSRVVTETGMSVELFGRGVTLLWLNIRDGLNRIFTPEQIQSIAQRQHYKEGHTRNANDNV